jgi:hypothetical protein
MSKWQFGLRLVAVVAILASAPTAAMAYIDPGNGAYMVQVLFTIVGAALFYLRHPVRTMKAAWHWVIQRGKPGSIPSEDLPGTDDESSVKPGA